MTNPIHTCKVKNPTIQEVFEYAEGKEFTAISVRLTRNSELPWSLFVYSRSKGSKELHGKTLDMVFNRLKSYVGDIRREILPQEIDWDNFEI